MTLDCCIPLNETKTNNLWGPDKRAYIAALWQAKFYLPQQAAAAAAHETLFYPSCTPACLLWQLFEGRLPQYTCGSKLDSFLSLVYCGSYTRAAYLQIHSCTRGIKKNLVYCGTSCCSRH